MLILLIQLTLAIEPCYYWAQNMTHLFVKIRFSPRFDMPGVVPEKYNVDIKIEGFSINATYKDIEFSLDVTTYKFLNPNVKKITQVELGQVIIEILKSPTPYFWKNLHSNVFYNPPNQMFWREMYYQYREQLEIAFGLLEDQENERELQESIKHTKEERLRLKNFQPQQNDDQLSGLLYCRGCEIIDPEDWSSWVI